MSVLHRVRVMYLKTIIKMQMENSISSKIRTKSDGELEFMASNNKWYPLDQADMAHLTDSVSWWNSTYR